MTKNSAQLSWVAYNSYMDYQHTDTHLAIESEYPKLVRDRIPEIIAADGQICDSRVIETDDEYVAELNRKAVEEATELAAATTPEHVLEEAADVLEVLLIRVAVNGHTLADIERIRDQKRRERGGFEERILMLGYKD